MSVYLLSSLGFYIAFVMLFYCIYVVFVTGQWAVKSSRK